MARRRDSEETRRRILEAACEVFGEKGYRDATHAEICALAEVNIAAINYHFGSKDALYRAAWQHAFGEAEALHPFDEGVTEASDPAERLRALVLALMRRRTNEERLRDFHAIHVAELFNPTGIVDDLLQAEMRRNRTYTQGMLRELLGEDATQRDLDLCELAVIGPIFMAFPPVHGRHPKPGMTVWAEDELDALADGVMAFAMGGIGAYRERIARRTRAERG